jgi:hypothetical protein
MARQPSQNRKSVVHCYLAALFAFTAMIFLSAGAWLWAAVYALMVIASAATAHRAYVSYQAVEFASKVSYAGRGTVAAGDWPSQLGTARRASAAPWIVTPPLSIARDHDRSPRQIWVRVSRLVSTVAATS